MGKIIYFGLLIVLKGKWGVGYECNCTFKAIKVSNVFYNFFFCIATLFIVVIHWLRF